MKFEKLPKDYYIFLKEAKKHILQNSKNEIFLWKLDELEQFNLEYESEIYVPSYYFIGSNGSGLGLAYKKNNFQLYTIPFIGMDEADALFVAESFTQFIELFEKEEIEIY